MRPTHPVNDVPGLVRDVGGKLEFHIANALVRVHVGFCLEGRLAAQELVAENSQGPEVDGLVMCLPLHHLWRQVV